MNCNECRYWGKESPELAENNIDVRCCNHSMVCRPMYGEGDNLAMTSSGVLTCDEGGMTGELMTGPNFGCIHFKAK